MSTDYLFLLDYDGTVARTFDKSPGGMGVHEAHYKVIGDLFGQEGVATYEAMGGLRNRAPSELIALLLENPRLRKAMKRRLNLPDDQIASEAIELFVEKKLKVLEAEIGKRFDDGNVWPRETKGFSELWNTLSRLNRDLPIRITTGIVSSGHTSFIVKSFQKLGLQLPDILVTEDVVRLIKNPSELVRRVKPGPLPIALAHAQWLRMQGVNEHTDGIVERARESRQRMVYAGDDVIKDGFAALGANLPFIHFAPHEETGSTVDGIRVREWSEVTKRLSSNEGQYLLSQGAPFRRVLKVQPTTLEATQLSMQFARR